MKLAGLLSKLAFIFNICFLLVYAMRLTPHLPQTEVGSLIIVAGYVVAVIVNALWNLCAVFLFISNKTLFRSVPMWLVVINLLFLIAEIIYFF